LETQRTYYLPCRTICTKMDSDSSVEVFNFDRGGNRFVEFPVYMVVSIPRRLYNKTRNWEFSIGPVRCISIKLGPENITNFEVFPRCVTRISVESRSEVDFDVFCCTTDHLLKFVLFLWVLEKFLLPGGLVTRLHSS